MYRTAIIAVPSAVGAIGLVVLIGAVYGYIIVVKRIVSQARGTSFTKQEELLLPN